MRKITPYLMVGKRFNWVDIRPHPTIFVTVDVNVASAGNTVGIIAQIEKWMYMLPQIKALWPASSLSRGDGYSASYLFHNELLVEVPYTTIDRWHEGNSDEHGSKNSSQSPICDFVVVGV